MSDPLLTLTTDESVFIIETEASTVAIAGVLSQNQERNGQIRKVPIAYASKLLKPVEQHHYGDAKLEMLAAKELIEKLEPFLVRGRSSCALTMLAWHGFVSIECPIPCAVQSMDSDA